MAQTRDVFCNRTLNLRSIQAIGYDMDYTLVHYQVAEWEKRAYEAIRDQLLSRGWPVDHLRFDPAQVTRGLVIDTEKGNLVKANRFGFIKHVMHGTKHMPFDEQRENYARTIIDLAEKRWVFLNTLFSLSEGCIYGQLVDLLDQKRIPGVLGYQDLYQQVRAVLDTAHMEGKLKAEIIAQPERFTTLDEETPLALLDQHYAGKKLLLITNSEWFYTQAMMTHAFDRFLPKGMTWRGLFDIVIVGARKPAFFTTPSPFFEIVSEEGYLKPTTGALRQGVCYLGGSAHELERTLGVSGDEILYVGDHMFGDVHVTKSVLRWRTALVIRELEEEIAAVDSFREQTRELERNMAKKQELEAEFCHLKTKLQRIEKDYGPAAPGASPDSIQSRLSELRQELLSLDAILSPLARAATGLSNPNWGLLMRAGNDKSYLAYQMERYADIYTSRVSNLLNLTPFGYLRSRRGNLPHDPA